MKASIGAVLAVTSLAHSSHAQARWVERESLRERAYHAATHDPVRGRTVTFGGRLRWTVPLDETWEWAGERWVAMHPAHRPSARFGAEMVFDTTRRVAVLFGGRGPTEPKRVVRIRSTLHLTECWTSPALSP